MKNDSKNIKRVLILFAFLTNSWLFGQSVQKEDVQTPEISPFSIGQEDLQGAVASSIKEVNGKVNFSVPIANINSRTVSYPVTLAYNGDNVFEQAQFLNRFGSQGAMGVGWSLNHPRIVVDHKGTGTREDDEFYLIDGTNNTRLINTDKQLVQIPGTGDSYMDFELEKYAPYKVRYKIENADFIYGNYTITDLDYWQITDDKGITYIYGNTDNSRENVLAWGNWIGDSKNTSGTSKHTTVWNLSKIQDQWGNNLSFTYLKIEGGITASSIKHTEAAYLSQITSSTGGKIVFSYGSKTTSEYYEPHKETNEPDAYQERLGTKYLDAISVYDFSDQLVFTYEMGYSLVYKAASSNSDRNRYLISITQKDNGGIGLPPQEFQYHTSGNFEGGIKKIIYPTGGSITYNYTEKTIFDSTNPTTVVDGSITSGYYRQGSYVGDDFAVELMSLGNFTHTGRQNYTFKLLNHFWIGEKWKKSEFILPGTIGVERDQNGPTYEVDIDNFRFVSGKDFYALLTFNRNTDKGSLFLFHKNLDGLSWKITQYTNFNLQSNNNDNDDFPYKDPTLMVGEDFVAVGENESTYGRLYTYVWNGNGWNTKTINQGIGTYYYGASNNFVISLDENGNGTDMITGATHPDYYYIHYLDAEKEWQTKSWSSVIDYSYTFVSATNAPSYLYPSNNMVGFMADNNPEYVIRWNTQYDIVAVDNVFGSYDDSYPLLPLGNNNFSVFKPDINTESPARFEKMAAFNGSTWVTTALTNNFGQGSGKNNMLSGIYSGTTNINRWYKYNPNNHSWSYATVSSYGASGTSILRESYSANEDMMLVGLQAHQISNTGSLSSLGSVLSGVTYGSYVLNTSLTNGRETFVEYKPDYLNNIGSSNYTRSFLLAVNRYNNTLMTQMIASGNIDQSTILNTINSVSKQMGGELPILSNNILNTNTGFKRIIDGQINKVVKDIVVSRIDMDNGAGDIRKIVYTYNNDRLLPNDRSVFYGEVLVKNSGSGSGNIGVTKKYFNVGEDDVNMAGLPTLVKVEDKNGVLLSETETVWKMFTKNLINSNYKTVGLGYYIRPETTIEKLTFGTDEVITETDYYYNSLGLLTSTSKVNSNGETVSSSIQYAYQNYTFLNDRNMIAFPYETRTNIGSDYLAIEQSIWKLENGKVFVYQNKSGTDYSNLRLNNEITKVDAYGNILESNNGQGIYKTVLYGHGNLFPVATISNATYAATTAQLDVTYSQLQNLTSTLESELVKLHTRLPKSMVNISLFDDQGRIVRRLDERKEAVNFLFDSFGRLEYTTDSNNKVIERKEYNYGGN
ncbi:SpvB/TcaC N-terminal domain-containing protein [Flagellimonas lutimaris]|uniref:SpvB/TcaC N-terminal domain-containing protein n=1 Tax=Flagellimonas lutimaris TaxID=475082 RepID=UPI003F5CCACA